MLRREITVTPQRILELASLQGIIDFFAELGYNTTIDQAPEKDVITRYELHRHDDLSSKIVHFKRIAQNKDETNTTLYVYFYVLKSVTIKIREDIVRDLLRRHSGEYLLILTTETTPFKELEFVFIDRIAGTEQHQPVVQQTLFDNHPPAPVGAPQIRALTVDCRHPDYRAVRLLRGLPYKHRYVLDQCKAISSAYDRAETSEEFFHNRSLFSDHYLKNRLPEEVSEWLQTAQEGFESDTLTEVSARLRRLYAGAARTFSRKSSSELRQLLFEPMLDLLGFTWNTTQKTNTRGNQLERRQPDYTLSMKDADGSPLAICLVYPWERNLDDYLESDDDDTDLSIDPAAIENPSAVVVSLLEQEKASWAILTNGRLWRLYSSKARSRATNYYEIDLLEALAIRREQTEDALKALRYFWLFFRAAAFYPKPRPDYETPPYICFLDYIMRESERYARALGDSLKERIFDDIFPYFAGGFVNYAQHIGHLPKDLRQRTSEERASLLQPFFEGTLAFLYRLLFLLYAESRDLLPVHDLRYHAKSVTKMKEEIAAIAKNNKTQAPKNIKERFVEDVTATDLYDRLQVLFTAIDKGDDELNVPTYNGGLFMTEVDANKAAEELTPDEKAARFLATYKIPDRELVLGLDLMARDEDERKGKATKREFALVYVDYKSLGVRQLGSIYEGLLEFKLRIAVEQMVVLKGKVLPLQEAIETGQYKPGRTKAIIYEPNTVYIENDRHERKATGSYYTPDYVVKYIIEQTIGPILQERFEKLRPRFREYQRAVQSRLKDNEQLKALKLPSKDLYATYKKYEEVAEEFFDLKVLDPAMGSGHFLVDAVDYITDKMTEFLRPLTPNPVHQKLQEIRNNIVAEVEAQGVSIDRSRLNELNLLKRQVLKRCVFGVDINYMAVTLTKVSLWLDTFTQGAPLSFLDYHLKWGNSLIGTTLSKIEKESEGFWFARDLSQVLNSAELARRLSLGTDATPKEIAEAHQVYDQLLDQVQPYKALLNVWVSQYFGDKWARTTAETCVDAILEQKTATIKRFNQEAYERAQELAAPQNKNFFHWELEFPEVFFRNNQRLSEGEAGFDAVIGNPPYYTISAYLSAQDISYLKQYYPKVYAGNSDILYYFLSLVATLPKRGGYQGMIVGRYFQESKYAESLRAYLVNIATLTLLVDFQNFQVFGSNVNVLASIVVFQKKKPEEGDSLAQVRRLIAKKPEERILSEALLSRESSLFDLFETSVPKDGAPWNFSRTENSRLFDKLRKNSILLGDIAIIVQSMQTGLNEVLAPHMKTVTEHSLETELIHPIAKSGSILRYEFEPLDRVIIWTQGIDINRYPNTKKYLLPFKDVLAARYDIKSRKANWWEISTPRNANLFLSNRPRILVPFVATGNKFCVDDERRLNDGGDIRAIFFESNSKYSEFYVCAILNSRACQYYHLKNTKLKRDGYYEYFEGQLSTLPIRYINFTTSQEQRTFYQNKAQKLYQQLTLNRDEQEMLYFVDYHLEQQPEASDVIHDLLAYLAECMLNLNKEKRKLQNSFLKFLEAKLEIQPQPDLKSGKVGLEALTKGKGQLLNYPRDYQKGEKVLPFDAVENILLENRRHFRQYLDSRLLREIEEEYTKNVTAIEKLKQQLKLTDDLIDKIVYKLYGLTEEEVGAIEEGN